MSTSDRLRKAIKDSALSEVRKERGMQSEYLYATYLGQGSQPGLSDIEILGETFQDIPKLQHVSLEGSWELITRGWHNDRVNVPIPGGSDRYSHMRIYLRIETDDGHPAIRINNDFTTDLHRWAYVITDANGNFVNSHDNDSTAWHLGLPSSALRNPWIVDIAHEDPDASGPDEDIGPYFTAVGHRRGSSTGGKSYSFAWGSLTDQRKIESFEFMTGTSDNIEEVFWTIYGLRRAAANPTLLCVRSKIVPLIIVGILDGETT